MLKQSLLLCMGVGMVGAVMATPVVQTTTTTTMPTSLSAADNNTSSSAGNSNFQAFDNQFYIGYGASYGNITNAYAQSANYGTNSLDFGIERLFDMGLWMRLDASLMVNYYNVDSANSDVSNGGIGQDPNIGNVNMKLGYAFDHIGGSDKFLLTPYVVAGRNTNITGNALNNNLSPNDNGTYSLDTNVTQDYFLSMGVGGRMEYRINDKIELYVDQSGLYNYDASNPNDNYTPATNYQLTSLIGAKFNVWKQLQLGIQGFYTYTILQSPVTDIQQKQFYPQNEFGGFVSIGMTY